MAPVDLTRAITPFALALLATGVGACHAARSESGRPGDAPPPAPSATPVAAHPSGVSPVFDVVANLTRCEVEHRGQLLDLGSSSVEGREAWRLTPDTNVTPVEREGASFARVAARSLTFAIDLDETVPVFVSARLRGLASRSATVLLDGKPFGTLTFSRNQTRLVATPLSALPVPAGPHTLGLRFVGTARGGDAFAEVDWLRIAPADDDPSALAAPTVADVSRNVALQGVPRRAIALRAPGRVHCTLGAAPGAHVRTAFGVLGNGEGEGELRLRRDGQPAQVLRTVHALGGDQASWSDVDVALPPSNDARPVTIEFAATQATRGARVLFGDPSVVSRPLDDVRPPRARAVLVVVLSGIDPGRLPPWAPDKPLPTFDVLAHEGVVFDRHRAPTTVVGGVLASLLTGLAPRQHGVEDPYARLPASLSTLATWGRDASVRTAMFTSHPATFEAFGFARDWDSFSARSPVSPALTSAPLDDLAAWVAKMGDEPSARLLGVAHARGIHPPFDVTPGEFAQMPPTDYAGPLDPRSAGQYLERARRVKKGNVKWSEGDAMRLSALIDAALAKTDRGLSNLIDALRKTGLWNDTLLIVTGDVAAATDPAQLPFAETLDLSEEALRVPLYVHFPGGQLAGKRVGSPTTDIDVTTSALDALGLDPPAGLDGVDLFTLASHDVAPVERPFEATLPDRFATRWGDLRLSGRDGSAPWLCDLAAGAHCDHDLRDALPLETIALWRWTYDHEALSRRDHAKRPPREPATLDPDTAAALTVWGR